MTISIWLTVVSICLLGAMSPGPSLAVVLKQTLSGGRGNGLITAVTHGLGIGLYALLSISGIAILLTTYPVAYTILQWGSAAYLIWLGFKGITATSSAAVGDGNPPTSGSAVRDGFLIVFLNPKVAIFFIALFSQIIGPDTGWFEKLVYAATAMLVDMGWYVLVAWTVSNPRWLRQLQKGGVWMDRAFGLVLIALAIRLLTLGPMAQ